MSKQNLQAGCDANATTQVFPVETLLPCVITIIFDVEPDFLEIMSVITTKIFENDSKIILKSNVSNGCSVIFKQRKTSNEIASLSFQPAMVLKEVLKK